jgi:hypothetical protein
MATATPTVRNWTTSASTDSSCPTIFCRAHPQNGRRTLSGVLCRAALSRTSCREPAVSGTGWFRQDAH